ncbi:MAG TPA: protein phosphatase 2C domain-containing protein [Pseudomonadales bacterium]|nr:protein phosphatase 2C domain-containing protein [Pseudomonadales bacterium]
MTLAFVAKSDSGRVRDHNEDCYFGDPDLGLFLVADGMGGMDAGEVASAIARDEVSQRVKAGAALTEAIESSHHAIKASAQQGIGAYGMGTTIVALRNREADYEIAWVGDSRAYLWDNNLRQLNRLTRDHSFVEMLLASGSITPDQAHKHPKKNLITQCLGQPNVEEVQVSTITGNLKSGQVILLCSDGLNDELTDDEIANVLASEKAMQAQAAKLLHTVLSGEARDNVTLLLIGHPETGTPVTAKPYMEGLIYTLVGAVVALACLTAMYLIVK